ncbi:MAG: thiamine diphosphokinase, partial [Bacteroidia bacterium]
ISSVAKYSQKVEIVLFDSYSKFYFLKKTFTKWYKKGQIISLIPFPVAKNIKSTGLKYPLNNEDLELGVRLGTSNVVPKSGMVFIDYENGKLLLMEVYKD